MKAKLFGVIFFVGSILLVGCNGHNNNHEVEENEEMEAPKEVGMNEAMEFDFLRFKNLSTNTLDVDARIAATNYKNNLLSTGRTTGLGWEERGPNNLGGRTRAICIDRRDATGNTVFAGGVSGGIWRCANFLAFNATWSKINDQMPNLAISCIVQDKVNNNHFYAGTGEGFFNADAARGKGVYKSTDGGVTWAVLPSTLDFEYTQDIVSHPSGALFVAIRNQIGTVRGIQKSINGGNTFTQVAGQPDAAFASGRGCDLEINSNGDVFASLGFSGSQGKLYRALANGLNTGNTNSWTEITPNFDISLQRIELAVSPLNPDKLFVIAQPSSGAIKSFKSIDGGNSWSIVNIPFLGASNTDFANTQGWYDLIAEFHPNEENTVLIGGLNVGRSTDFGDTWGQLSNWTNGSSFPYVHADQHNIVFNRLSPTNCGVIISNDGGMFYSGDVTAVVGSPTFSEKTTNYSTIQYYHGDYHPTNPNAFLAGAQDNGTHLTTTAGYGPIIKVTGGDGAFSHINQLNGDNQISAYVYNNYYLTANGWSGGTITRSLGGTGTTATGRFINPTDLDDQNNLLYCAHNANTYAILNNTNTPTASSFSTRTLAEFLGTRVSAIKVDPNSSNVVYMAGSGGATPVILKLTDANNAPPTVTDISILGTPNGGYVNSIEVETGNSNHIIAIISNSGTNNVYETTNGGTSWSAIDGNLPDMPVLCAVILPATASLNGTSATGGIVLGTEVGVWSTTNSNGSATSWLPDNSGMANTRVTLLRYKPSMNQLVAFTHGRGIFTSILPVVSAVNNLAQDHLFVNYIAANRSNVLIKTGNLNGIQPMDIKIYDMRGAVVMQQRSPYQPTQLNIDALPSAMYTIQIISGKRRYVGQIVK